MKKVLHRSFKPAKCKIALQMAISRLKILKNKKYTQIKQLRRELANLLESGQTQTAKIRVEHVVREETTMAAYELVSIYCELLFARLGVIESQKACSNDLKEAISSVLYASQRLSEVAELKDVVKHFSAKYGKDFVSAAFGLQSDSGVSRLLVEKLSGKSPDGLMKMKILKEIALEFNVVWEDESLVELDPKETVLLSGASSSSQSTNGINSNSSRIPNNQAPATINISQNSYATPGRTSNHIHDTTFSDIGVEKTTNHFHQDPRPSGEYRNLNHDYRNSSPWETEFTDATTAAEAATESAERAGFAARIAAELSSKERMMNSTKQSGGNRQDQQLSENASRRRGYSPENSLKMRLNQPSIDDVNLSSSEDVKLCLSDDNDVTAELSENASRRRDYSPENSRPNQPSIDDVNLSSSEDVKLSSRSLSDDNDVTVSDSPENRFLDTESYNTGPDVVVVPDSDDYKPKFDREDDGLESPLASVYEPKPFAKFDNYDRDSENEEEDILSGIVVEKPKLISQNSMSEVPDDLGRYFFPSDTEDQGDESRSQEESDEVETGEVDNEETLRFDGMSPARDKTLSKSVKEHVQTEIDRPRSSSSLNARNSDKRPSSLVPDSSSSDDETKIEVSIRELRTGPTRPTRPTLPTNLHLREDDSEEEEIPMRASKRSTPASSSYFYSISSDDEDEEEEFRREASDIRPKSSISTSRRTKGQERRSSFVTAKTDKDSQESPTKLIPEAKPLVQDQESPPKLVPKVKPLAKQHESASSSSSVSKTVTSLSPDSETPAKEKASHVHPKLPDYDDIFAKLGALRR